MYDDLTISYIFLFNYLGGVKMAYFFLILICNSKKNMWLHVNNNILKAFSEILTS